MGVAADAKTGLAAAVVGVLFLAVMFLSPLAALVPSYATAPALMYVGLLMLGRVVAGEWRKLNVGGHGGNRAGARRVLSWRLGDLIAGATPHHEHGALPERTARRFSCGATSS